jgi:Flp pilus assembly protein TadG
MVALFENTQAMTMTHTLVRRETRTMPGGIGGRAQRLLGKTCGRLRHVYRDDSGSAYVFTALTFTAMIGFVGIGIDVTNFYAQRRITQNMADAAAVAGTYADMDGGNVEDSAEAAAEDNGYDSDGTGNSLTVDDAAAGLGGGLTTARVDVTVQRRVPLIVTDLFTPNAFVTVSARAVGGTRSLGPLCIVALDQSASRALEFTGNTTANVGCGVASNSSAGDALYVGGSATLVANPAQAHGGIIESGSGDIQTQLPLLPYAPRVADPYAGRTLPGPVGCAAHSSIRVNPGATLNLDAGGGCMVIDGDAEIKGTLTLGSGTYYIDGGDLSINSQAIVEGLSASSEVTLVLTGSTPADVGDIDIRGGATVSLKEASGFKICVTTCHTSPSTLSEPADDAETRGLEGLGDDEILVAMAVWLAV